MRWNIRRLNNEGGFTLVEVVISIFILSIVIASASVAFIYSTKTTRDNELRMNALNIANEKIENIRAMSFSEVGTKFKMADGTYINGDPPGEILQEEIVDRNGVKYLVKVTVSWEEEADWDVAGSASWDYKSVRVSVTPQVDSTFHRLEQSIETYVTRDIAQPAKPGANIRIRCVRGWNPDAETKVVQGVNVQLFSGPNPIRFVHTSSKGIASFLDLTPGTTYLVKADPEASGYMVFPNESAIWDNITLTEIDTRSFELKLEYPCTLRLVLKDLAGNPIRSSNLSPGATGKVSLTLPFPAGNVLEAIFPSTDINAEGKLPESLISNLWPVGAGHSGAYTLTNVTLDKLQFLGDYTKVGANEVPWDGTFDGPGTVKEIILYFNVTPVTPEGIATDWVDSSNSIRVGSYLAVDEDDDPIQAGVLQSSNLSSTLKLEQNRVTHFNGLRIFVENIGTPTTSGLYIGKNSTLSLHGSEIVFRGKVEVENEGTDGRIYLSTTWEDGRETATIYGSRIDDEDAQAGKAYGKLYLMEPLFLGDDKAIDAGAYYFPNGTTLPDQSSELIPITKENYVE